MKLLLLPLTIFITLTTSAQSWQWGARGGGGSNGGGSIAETVVDMVTDNGGNVYVLSGVNGGVPITVTGMPNAITNYGRRDILVTSYGCDGAFRWKKMISGGGDDNGMAIGVDTLGSVFVTGAVSPANPPSQPPHFDSDTAFTYSNFKMFFIIKYDTAGNFKWLRQPTPDTMAFSRQFTCLPRDMIVNGNGEVEILCYLSPGLLTGSNIVVDTPSAYILKYDKDGNITGLVKPDLNWRQVPGDGMAHTSLYSIRMVKTKSGKYVVAGAQNFQTFPPYSDPLMINWQPVISRIFVASFSSSWKNEWLKKLDTPAVIQVYYRPVIDAHGSIYIAGPGRHNDTFNNYTITNAISSSGVPFIVKLDSFGNLQWGKNASTNAVSGASGVAINNDRAYVAGRFPGKLTWDNFSLENPSNTGYDIFLTGFDLATGDVVSLDSLKGNPGQNDNATALISDTRGNIYLGGEIGSNFTIGSSTLQSAGGNSDFFIAKYGTADCSGTIVPVRLTTFTATLQNNDVLTRWQTAQEQNTKAFIVERSTNAVHFIPIGTVPAKGNSNVVQTYSFTDTDLFPSANSQLTTHNSLFYRLKILDLDGSYTYSAIAKINHAAIKGISIYPNPVRSTAVVSYKLANGSANGVLEVYSMIGHKISSTTLPAYTGTQTLNTAALPGGIYNVVLRSNGKVVGSEKLVVEK